MEYLSISQTAEKWGLSKRRVQVLCSENRIPGVMRVAVIGQFQQMLRSQRMQESVVENM